VRPVLLLSADLLPVCEVDLGGPANVGGVPHGQGSTLHAVYSVHLVVHLKDFLLLGRELPGRMVALILVSLVHYCKPHRAGHEDIVAIGGADLVLGVVSSFWDVSRRLVTIVVSHVSAAGSNCVLLIVTIEFLNIKTLTSLVGAESGSESGLQRCVGSSASLCMEVFSQVGVRLSELVHDAPSIGTSCTSLS